ncbi:hypothetical protein AMAG_10413 [Allomyces macrogynus ATCC 38327]|uniref:Uncharacterized protein n=1 Tax=Allomyces macrogynus (strain ATCC 38327) TaxID=578462 RepID=A0A0L0SV02_ALLM3|nr:hypothetical protein AMAG_10413 [Allomyces macrogynus ATCC 38327]|eukprot:KNE66164.1 hypothetical protein AMAG_10413 [Allomyces macrogynus ATCC 38327]
MDPRPRTLVRSDSAVVIDIDQQLDTDFRTIQISHPSAAQLSNLLSLPAELLASILRATLLLDSGAYVALTRAAPRLAHLARSDATIYHRGLTLEYNLLAASHVSPTQKPVDNVVKERSIVLIAYLAARAFEYQHGRFAPLPGSVMEEQAASRGSLATAELTLPLVWMLVPPRDVFIRHLDQVNGTIPLRIRHLFIHLHPRITKALGSDAHALDSVLPPAPRLATTWSLDMSLLDRHQSNSVFAAVHLLSHPGSVWQRARDRVPKMPPVAFTHRGRVRVIHLEHDTSSVHDPCDDCNTVGIPHPLDAAPSCVQCSNPCTSHSCNIDVTEPWTTCWLCAATVCSSCWLTPTTWMAWRTVRQVCVRGESKHRSPDSPKAMFCPTCVGKMQRAWMCPWCNVADQMEA